MRLAALCTAAAVALQPSSHQRGGEKRAASHRSKAEADDVDADFRKLLATGLTPTDAFTPVDVAALALRALRSGDERFLHRFSTPEFARSRAQVKFCDASLVIYTQAPAGVQRRGSTFEGLGNGQYAILREEYTADLDDDILVLDDEAFLRVRLEDASDAHVTLSDGSWNDGAACG